VIIPYLPIRDENMKVIINLKLGRYNGAFRKITKSLLTYDGALVDEVAKRCTEVESGARNVDNILTNTLLPEISRQLLGRMAEGESMERIHVGVGSDGDLFISRTRRSGRCSRPLVAERRLNSSRHFKEG